MKKLFCLLLAFVMLFFTAACADSNSSDTPGEDSSGATVDVSTGASGEDSTATTEPDDITAPSVCEHAFSLTQTVDSTCVSEGCVTYTCELCGDTYTEEIPSLGHDYSEGKCVLCGEDDPDYQVGSADCIHDHRITDQQDADCTRTGRIIYTCEKCGNAYSQMIAAKGHDYISGTCTQPSTCAVCGSLNGSPLGHSYGSNGLCIRCGESDPENGPEQSGSCAHAYRITDRKESSCVDAGSVTYTCAKCEHRYVEKLNATGHSYTPRTCTAPAVCSLCGITNGSALGHSYTSSGKCARCGAVDPDYQGESTKPIACSHKMTSATCTKASTCTLCGYVKGNALGHSYSLKSETAATCTAAGSRIYACDRCAHTYQESIAAAGHAYAAATCERPKTCSLCGDTSGQALGHSYGSDWLCVRCGAEDPSAPSDVVITVRSDKGVAIPNITVTIYAGTDTKPAGSAVTNSKGQVTIGVKDISSGYRVVLSNVPANYIAKDVYSFSATRANIALTSASFTTPTDHSNANYKVGSTMGEFTLTDTDGNTYTLSQMLEDKQLVILNFWYVACSPCKAEFPYFEAVYKRYQEDMTLLTMSHFDSEESIIQLRQQMGVTFPMIREDIGFREGFGLTMYPTTVFISGSGKILEIKVGGFSSEAEFENALLKYLKA